MTGNRGYPEHPCYNSNAHECTNKRPPCNKDITGLLVRLDPIAQEMRDEARKNMGSVTRNKTVQISIDIEVEISSLQDSHTVNPKLR